MTPACFSKPVKIKGLITRGVCVDSRIDARKEYIGFNCTIHTSFNVNTSVKIQKGSEPIRCEHGIRQQQWHGYNQ